MASASKMLFMASSIPLLKKTFWIIEILGSRSRIKLTFVMDWTSKWYATQKYFQKNLVKKDYFFQFKKWISNRIFLVYLFSNRFFAETRRSRRIRNLFEPSRKQTMYILGLIPFSVFAYFPNNIFLLCFLVLRLKGFSVEKPFVPVTWLTTLFHMAYYLDGYFEPYPLRSDK